MAALAPVDLDSTEALDAASDVRRFILIAFLFAIGEKAEGLHFGPLGPGEVPECDDPAPHPGPPGKEPKRCRVRAQMAGALRDMVPMPYSALRVVHELVRLLHPGEDADRSFRRLALSPSGSFQLRVGPALVDVSVSVEGALQSPRAAVHFRGIEDAHEKARELAGVHARSLQALHAEGKGGLLRRTGLRDWWPWLSFQLFLLGMLLAGAFYADPWDRQVPYRVSAAATAIALMALFPPRAVRRFALFKAHTRAFLEASNDRFALRYAPALQGKADPKQLLGRATQALEELEARLGSLDRPRRRRRRKVKIYVFSQGGEVEAIFGKGYQAWAQSQPDVVTVTLDPLMLDEYLRHELAHLFAFRWNTQAPPLLSEGLPTWLQGTWEGYAIDLLACCLLVDGMDYPLRRLLGRRFFFHQVNRSSCYTLAGSFTGFLLRRFGPERYKAFYRTQWGRWRFETRFARHFGARFAEAEQQWRQELLQRCEVPQPNTKGVAAV